MKRWFKEIANYVMLCHGRAQNILYFQEFEFLIIVDAYLEVILVTKKGSLYNFSYNLRC